MRVFETSMRRSGWTMLVVIVCAILSMTSMSSCNSGVISNGWGDADADADADSMLCPTECEAGTRCQNGECILIDSACLGVVCQQSTHCEQGLCVADDLCAGVVCSNRGEVCQAGLCVPGAADDDGDGVVARDDCDDTNPNIYPGAPERCNGLADACDETLADGIDECPDLCCGDTPSCRECCETIQCGSGPWECRDFGCLCNGVLCGDECHDPGSCCNASDCGIGVWRCEDNRCACPGITCDGECFETGECCSSSDCGSGDWSCPGRECSCDLLVIGSSRCGLCSGTSYSGHGCSGCPAGSYEVYCPGPGCSRACNTDSSCSNRYRHAATDPWIDYPQAFCFSGTHMDDTYWEMR